MTDTSSVDVILDFLKRNRFTRAEAALRSELTGRPDLNGFLRKLGLEEDSPGVLEGENGSGGKSATEINQGSGSRSSGEVSKELIVKEIECGTGRNGSESKWRNAASIGERNNKSNDAAGTSAKNFTFSKGSEDAVLDLYTWNSNAENGPSDSYGNDGGNTTNNVSEQSKFRTSETANAARRNLKAGDLETGEQIIFSGEKRASWVGSTSNVSAELKYEKMQTSEKAVDQQHKSSSIYSKETFGDNPWSKNEDPADSSSDLWKECSVKTVFPFSKRNASTSYDIATGPDKKEGKQKVDTDDVRAAIKHQVDEVGRALYFGKSQGNPEPKNISSLVFPLSSDNPREELPRLPPVKLKSEDKPLGVNWEEKFDRDGPSIKLISPDSSLLIGSFLDVPVGQEITSGFLMIHYCTDI